MTEVLDTGSIELAVDEYACVVGAASSSATSAPAATSAPSAPSAPSSALASVAEARGLVMLLHGGGQTKHSWRATGQALSAAGWQVVAPDTRGHGASQWAVDGDYSMERQVDDLVALTAHYPDPIIVGASSGGIVALVALAWGAISARALVMVDIALQTQAVGVQRVSHFMLAHPDGFANLDEVVAVLAEFNPQRRRPASAEGLARVVRLRPDGRWYWHWDPAFLHVAENDTRRTLSDLESLSDLARQVDIPILLVRGRESDVLSAETAREFVARAPAVRVVDVVGAGHTMAADVNDAFTGVLRTFLDELDAPSLAPRAAV